MTALNILLLGGEAHIFSDGGHYRDGLRRIGSKVRHLPHIDAALVYSGPSCGLDRTLEELERRNLRTLDEGFSALPECAWMADRFSAVLVGVEGGVVRGRTVEEGDRVRDLGEMDFVRSIASKVDFDPFDVDGSGLAMMEDQRRSGVVGAYCLRSRLGAGRLHSDVLRRWDDQPLGLTAADTTAAKIQDLTVTSLKIKNNAITGLVETAVPDGSIYVPNGSGYMIQLTGFVQSLYSGNQTSSSAQITIQMVRSRDSLVLFDRTITGSGNTSGGTQQKTAYAFAADVTAEVGETYTLAYSASSSFGGAWTSTVLQGRAYYKKK